MLGRTHEVAAVGAVASAAILFPVKDMTFETATLSLLTALVGGLTPDIDKQGSTIWDKMPAGGCLSRIVHPVFIGGHRHITHSFLGMFLFGIGMRALLTVLPFGPGIDGNILFLSFMIAFGSHLFTDMLTKEGVPLFFPLPFHIGLPPFEFLRLQTNGMVEKLLITPGIIAVVVVLGYLYPDNAHALLSILGIK
ncbi:metal-dependent hydrolase [Candidatus Aquicultor secundus]|uniref:metal-dependent hydrolase n=2 Tax=Candidatus Aquicultor secundus TaxID=1973895 RepID=UPI00257AD72E|nr:metal-dependent hydrolase [Candidatus Aquicultor secundus]